MVHLQVKQKKKVLKKKELNLSCVVSVLTDELTDKNKGTLT